MAPESGLSGEAIPTRSQHTVGDTYHEAKAKAADTAESAKLKASEKAEQAKWKVSEKADQAKWKASEKAEQAKEKASETAEQVKEKSSEWLQSAKETAVDTKETVKQKAADASAVVQQKASDVAEVIKKSYNDMVALTKVPEGEDKTKLRLELERIYNQSKEALSNASEKIRTNETVVQAKDSLDSFYHRAVKSLKDAEVSAKEMAANAKDSTAYQTAASALRVAEEGAKDALEMTINMFGKLLSLVSGGGVESGETKTASAQAADTSIQTTATPIPGTTKVQLTTTTTKVVDAVGDIAGASSVGGSASTTTQSTTSVDPNVRQSFKQE